MRKKYSKKLKFNKIVKIVKEKFKKIKLCSLNRETSLSMLLLMSNHTFESSLCSQYFFSTNWKMKRFIWRILIKFRVMDGNSIHLFSLSLLLNRKLRKYLSMMNWKYICHCTKIDFLKMSRKWKKITKIFF